MKYYVITNEEWPRKLCGTCKGRFRNGDVIMHNGRGQWHGPADGSCFQKSDAFVNFWAVTSSLVQIPFVTTPDAKTRSRARRRSGRAKQRDGASS